MSERIPTTERLARALEEAKAPQHMIERARKGYYDDYKSQHATPIALLVQHCTQYDLTAIADRAIDGEFDGTKEDADEWAKSPEGQEVMSAFGLVPGNSPVNLGNVSGPGPALSFSRKRRKH